MGTHADLSKGVFTANSGSTRVNAAAPTPARLPGRFHNHSRRAGRFTSARSREVSGVRTNVSMTSPGHIHVDANTGSVKRAKTGIVAASCRSPVAVAWNKTVVHDGALGGRPPSTRAFAGRAGQARRRGRQAECSSRKCSQSVDTLASNRWLRDITAAISRQHKSVCSCICRKAMPP
jgi:hypothetical protein